MEPKTDAERREVLDRMKRTWFSDFGADTGSTSESALDEGGTGADSDDAWASEAWADDASASDGWEGDDLAEWILSGGLASDGASRSVPRDPPSPELRAAYAELDPQVLDEAFPDFNVSLDVAEQVDDLVADPERAEAPALAAAFEVIAGGLDRCAVLKQLASQPIFEAISRRKLTEIRNQKSTILGIRSTLERRQKQLDDEAEAREREEQAWREAGEERPTGFAAMFSKPGDAEAAKRRAEDRRELLQGVREFERDVHEDLMERRRKLGDEQHREFLRLIQGRRYY